MILKLVPHTDPILRKELKPFDFEKENAAELFVNLKETMIAERGAGLSACQVGIDARVFVIGDPRNEESIIPVFNPKIISLDGDVVLGEEGCLTFPNFYVKIKRYNWTIARFANVDGSLERHRYSGWTSRVFQHEMDHMNGILFLDRASRYHLNQAKKHTKKINRLRKKNAKIAVSST